MNPELNQGQLNDTSQTHYSTLKTDMLNREEIFQAHPFKGRCLHLLNSNDHSRFPIHYVAFVKSHAVWNTLYHFISVAHDSWIVNREGNNRPQLEESVMLRLMQSQDSCTLWIMTAVLNLLITIMQTVPQWTHLAHRPLKLLSHWNDPATYYPTLFLQLVYFHKSQHYMNR